MRSGIGIKPINLGVQDFGKLREEDCFLIDKTEFIREWWESRDDVTLITRPRRFGKILNMSMMNCFFPINMQAGMICLRICLYGHMKNIGSFRECILLFI